MTQLWQCVAAQVTSQGLALGTYASLPARHDQPPDDEAGHDPAIVDEAVEAARRIA